MKEVSLRVSKLPRDQWPTIEGYELIDHIGAGGQSHVFKAKQVSFDRPVKIKICWPFPTGDKEKEEEEILRFLSEAKVIARLSHQYLEKYYDQGKTADNKNYIVTELFKGQSISNYLKEHSILEFEDAIKIMIKVCGGIGYCHSENVIHRDLKPANILIDDKQNIKIIDFGIAYDFEEKIRNFSTGSPIGTPGYWSLEQRKDPKHRDRRADIYSLGVTIYEMLTGNLPGDNYPSLLASKCANNIDPQIDDIITKCLQPINTRYQVIEELINDLSALQFLKLEEKRREEEMRIKSSEWAQSVAQMKKVQDIESEISKKKFENEKKKDGEIWLKTIKLHLSDIAQIVNDLNKTGVFNLNFRKEDINERPNTTRETVKYIASISLNENEEIVIGLSVVDLRRVKGKYIQPCIIWKSRHTHRAPKEMYEMTFTIDNLGNIRVMFKKHKPYEENRFKNCITIQEVYQKIIKDKLIWNKRAGESLVTNIVSILSLPHYQARLDYGYKPIEKLIEKGLQLDNRIADELFNIFADSKKSDGERGYCVNLLQQASYFKIANKIMAYWLQNGTEISDKLSGQISNYFSDTVDCLDLLIDALEKEVSEKNKALPHIFIAIRAHVTYNRNLDTARLNRVLDIIAKYKNIPHIFDILTGIYKEITDKNLQKEK